MDVVDGAITLNVDTAGARYPITIDPTITEDQKVLPRQYGQMEFGERVDIDGALIVVADPDDRENGFGSGAVSVYRFNGFSWVLETKLLGPDLVQDNGFAWDVAVEDGATHELILVGAPYDDANGLDSGAVYAYVNTGGGWSLDATLHQCTLEGCDPSAAPSGGFDGLEYGYAIDIVETGTTLVSVIGSPAPWVPTGGDAHTVEYDTATGFYSTPNTLAARSNSVDNGESFGASVTISPDGSRIGIGSPSLPGSSNPGRVVWYDRSPGVDFDGKATTVGTAPGFGTELDMDNVRAVVGSPGVTREGSLGLGGGFTAYDLTTIAAPSQVASLSFPSAPRYGASVSIDSDHLQIGIPGTFANPDRGGVEFLQWDGSTFVSLGKRAGQRTVGLVSGR